MATRRRAIPAETRRYVLMEAGYRCGNPTCRNILAIDIHHMEEVAEGGGNEPDNLIALCGVCHDLYHREEITREAIRNWKGILAALNYAFDREAIDALLFLHNAEASLMISGDGVLNFMRLIGAGLASFHLAMQNGPLILYGVRLTPKGQMLVEAWFSGERTAVEDALAYRG